MYRHRKVCTFTSVSLQLQEEINVINKRFQHLTPLSFEVNFNALFILISNFVNKIKNRKDMAGPS